MEHAMFLAGLHLKHLTIPTLTILTLVLPASGDELRNVKKGEPLPACKLPAIDGAVVDSESLKGSVVVYVCLSAEQNRSELAATESFQVVHSFGNEPVKLIHVSADVLAKPYFEKFRAEHSITSPLALDADRNFYAKLGLIVFPTTVIVNKEGKLDSVISLHSSEYKSLLDAHVRHALGTLSDKDLEARLSTRASEESSPKSAASAHRALARLMREKGQLDQAKAELLKGRQMDPDNREIMLDLADLDISSGDLDGADDLIAKVLQSQPDHRRAKQLKGVVLFRRDRLEEARVILEESLALNPSPELAHYYLGRIFETQGKTEQALEHYKAALKYFVKESDPGARSTSPTPPAPPAETKPSK
jgi:thioredoxin-like negative regulator of GroEL